METKEIKVTESNGYTLSSESLDLIKKGFETIVITIGDITRIYQLQK